MVKTYLKAKKFIDTLVDSLSIKTEYFLVGMNIETKKLLSILVEKIDEDITMLLGSHEGGNQYLSDTLLDKICGMEMVSV
jgi:hypothetical protein